MEIRFPGRLSKKSDWRDNDGESRFFLAATILCLDLDRDLAARSSSQINGEAADKRRGDDVTHALHESYKIWLKSSKEDYT